MSNQSNKFQRPSSFPTSEAFAFEWLRKIGRLLWLAENREIDDLPHGRGGCRYQFRSRADRTEFVAALDALMEMAAEDGCDGGGG